MPTPRLPPSLANLTDGEVMIHARVMVDVRGFTEIDYRKMIEELSARLERLHYRQRGGLAQGGTRREFTAPVVTLSDVR
jgi:hypothetical protein